MSNETFRRITKHVARKRFEQDLPIRVCPVKLCPGGAWRLDMLLQKSDDTPDFDNFLSYFVSYNCSYETGYYPAFYIV